MPNPAIILVSEHHVDTLLEVFYRRYGYDYDLRSARTCADAEKLALEIVHGGGQVALFVSDSRLPDVPDTEDHPGMFEAVHRFRLAVPSARRVITPHWDYFLTDADRLGPMVGPLAHALVDRFLDDVARR